jgi:hypothetical protein
MGAVLKPLFDIGAPVSDRSPDLEETRSDSSDAPLAQCIVMEAEKPSGIFRRKQSVRRSASFMTDSISRNHFAPTEIRKGQAAAGATAFCRIGVIFVGFGAPVFANPLKSGC